MAIVAISLAAQGCRVVLADVQVNAINAVSQHIIAQQTAQQSLKQQPQQHDYRHPVSSSSSLVLPVSCNVTDPVQVQELMARADEFAASSLSSSLSSSATMQHQQQQQVMEDRATILINCAGITRDNWITKMTLEEWDEVLDVNLKATFLTCRAFLNPVRYPSLLDAASSSTTTTAAPSSSSTTTTSTSTTTTTTSSSIINIGSIVSEHGNLAQVNYAASKGGVVGLTRALAKEVAPRGIRVNAILPGFIATPMTDKVPSHIAESVILPKIPLQRFGHPMDVAHLVCFLASAERSGYITGASIPVSGMIAL
jgi:17beta-estradiol 17-dehydrogenase / 3alpha(17beta)-hydroxysteroid dehydrogenase (NAD+) / 3-oxoacyl-[acyl-carrier protein] reductase alpha subunit